MMTTINMFRGAMFLALFVCTAGEPSSSRRMPDNSNVNVRFFLTCTCQELKCYLAREMGKYVDLLVIIWNFGLKRVRSASRFAEMLQQPFTTFMIARTVRTEQLGAAYRRTLSAWMWCERLETYPTTRTLQKDQ